MPVITARLAVTATSASLLLLALPGEALWLIAINVVLMVAASADYLTAPDPRKLVISRDLPPRLQIGAEAVVGWEVGVPRAAFRRPQDPSTRRTVSVDLADDLLPSLQPGTRRPRLLVPVGGRGRATTTISPARRGNFRPSTITVRVQGRFGLAGRQRDVDVHGRLTVLPAFPSRKQAELRISQARLADAGERTSRGRGAGGEFDSLRDYTVDDEFRRIDWAATARARTPVVRTYRAEQNQTVIVLVDAGRTMAGRIGDVPRLDFALDAAMGLTMVATRLGDRAGLVVFDRNVRAVVPPRGRRDQLSTVSEVLAETYPNLVESDYRSAFVTSVSRFRRRALLVVLTDLSPGAVEQTLLPALGLVSRTHEVIVAGVSDPTVWSWATGEPSEASTAFRAAAATEALAGRRHVAGQLQAAGARVVDARPGELTGILADTYLRLKSQGRL